MTKLYAIRPLIIQEDQGRAFFGAADAYHCCTPHFALKRAAMFDREAGYWGDHRVFDGEREIFFSSIDYSAHCRTREAALCDLDMPF